MNSVLITGSNGFLSYYLIPKLLNQGFQVIGMGKGDCRFECDDDAFTYETADFTDKEKLVSLFEKYSPNIVIHTGAISKPDECELHRENAFLTNVTGTINLLKESEKHKSFFIFLSTDFVFSGDQGFYKEEDERAPVNYYGQTKLLAEDEVMQYSYEWAIVRTILVYGRSLSGRENIVTNVAKSLQRGEQLKIFNDQVRTPTYVKDLAEGIVQIMKKRATGIFHISGEDVRTPYEIAVDVAEYLNVDRSLITSVSASEFNQPAKRPLKTGFDISKAKKELDFKPLSFKEGLKKTLETMNHEL